MAKDVDKARQIVIDEANGYVTKLENGHAGDLHTIGRAVGLNMKMTIAVFENNFRTEEACDKLRKQSKGKTTRIKAGPFEYEGKISAVVLSSMIPLICCGGLGFMLGKANGWW